MNEAKKMLVCFGTRPEYLKLKPIIKVLGGGRHEIFYTGQQNDLVKGLDARYRCEIERDKNRLNGILTSALRHFPDGGFEGVMVQGDTGSAFGCALAAFNLKKRIVYVESGLRTNDLSQPFPEECYRQMISRMADIHFCPTELSSQNLLKENIDEDKIHVVGNTSLDNLLEHKDKSYYGDEVLITLHRRENLGAMREWIRAINDAVEAAPHNGYTWPMHPNPEIQSLRPLVSPRIKVVDPLDHDSMIRIMSECKFIVTDSGGVQEEGCFLNKKVIVCREGTERPEGIDTGHLLICGGPEGFAGHFSEIDKRPWVKQNNPCPYGDGRSGEKIVRILEEKKYI